MVLQIRSSLFSTIFLVWTNWFSLQKVPCRFSLNLLLFGLRPSCKGLGTNLKLSTNKIAWICWSLNLGPLSKVTFRLLIIALNNPHYQIVLYINGVPKKKHFLCANLHLKQTFWCFKWSPMGTQVNTIFSHMQTFYYSNRGHNFCPNGWLLPHY